MTRQPSLSFTRNELRILLAALDAVDPIDFATADMVDGLRLEIARALAQIPTEPPIAAPPSAEVLPFRPQRA